MAAGVPHVKGVSGPVLPVAPHSEETAEWMRQQTRQLPKSPELRRMTWNSENAWPATPVDFAGVEQLVLLTRVKEEQRAGERRASARPLDELVMRRSASCSRNRGRL